MSQNVFGLPLQAKAKIPSVGIIANSYDIDQLADLEFRAVVGFASSDATEIRRQSVLPTLAKLRNLTVEIDMNTRDVTTFINLRVNGVNGNLSAVIPASLSGTFTDSINSDNVFFGDLINYQTIFLVGSGAIFIVSASMESTIQ